MTVDSSASVLTASAIVKLAEERKGQQGSRTGAYSKFLAAYNDETIGEQSMQANYVDGRPAMRILNQARHDLMQRRGAPNFIRPVVKDFTAIYGVMPDVLVQPEGDDGEQQKVATKRTRILKEVIAHSKLRSQQARFGFYQGGLGDSCWTFDVITPKKAKELGDRPDKPPGVYINVISPTICYPSFEGGRSSRDLNDLLICDKVTPEEAKRQYGVDTLEGQDKVDIITFYSKKQRTVVVRGATIKQVEHVEHNLGFCPAEWFSKEVTDGQLAQSDIAAAIDMHYELQALYYIFVDTIMWSAYPITVVQGGQQAMGQESLDVGPGSMVTVGIGGGVQVVAPQGNPQAAHMIFDTALDQFMKTVGESPVRIDGGIDRSNVTGRAVNNMQSPMQGRVNLAYVVLGERMELAYGKVMRMYSQIKELAKAEFPLYGNDDKGTYNESFSGADLGSWVRNQVKWDSFIGSDHTEKLHNALLLFQANPHQYPWRRVLEEAGEEDPDKLIAEAEAAAKQLQVLMPEPGEVGPGGPPGGSGGMTAPGPLGAPPPKPAPGGSAPTQPAPGPEPNGPQQTPGAAAPMPEFPQTAVSPEQMGVPTPPPLPDILSEIQAAMAGVQLHGEILEGPRPEPGGIFVRVSDHRDIKPVRDALLPVVQSIYGPDAKVTVTAKAQKSA